MLPRTRKAMDRLHELTRYPQSAEACIPQVMAFIGVGGVACRGADMATESAGDEWHQE